MSIYIYTQGERERESERVSVQVAQIPKPAAQVLAKSKRYT